jgi:DNA-binding IclR family transcriptional regulator
MDEMIGDTNQSAYKAPAVHRAFSLLRILADSDHPLRLSEISERLGCSKSTTHGLVHALARENALRKESKGPRYYIGPSLADLVFSDWNYFKINQAAKPIIDSIWDATNETVFLGARLGNRVLIMLTAESSNALKISADPGTTIPLFAGAVGKVFMALKSDDQVSDLLHVHGLPKYTPNTITNKEDYLSEIKKVRRLGYALDIEEYITGVCAVAVALGNYRGPSMAVWVVGMNGNMASDKIQQVVDFTSQAAASLNAAVEGKTV